MTQNQIDYAKLLETRRSNRAQEGLTSARDQRAYEVNFFNAQENQRANLEKEKHNRAVLDETSRANRAKEVQAARELAENTRYHSMNVGLGYSQLAETSRANKEREAETHRSNVADETERTRHNISDEYNNTKLANIKDREAYTKERQVDLDQQKLSHQKGLDYLNYDLEAKRVELLAEHQETVDEATAEAARARAARDYAAAMNQAYQTGSAVGQDVAAMAVALG